MQIPPPRETTGPSIRVGSCIKIRSTVPKRNVAVTMVSSTMRNAFFGAVFTVANLRNLVDASPTLVGRAQIKNSATELLDSYDYVIIGGGTSGLAVSNRLSEDPSSERASTRLPSRCSLLTLCVLETVLVIELGYLADEKCIWQSYNMLPSNDTSCAKHRFNSMCTINPCGLSE